MYAASKSPRQLRLMPAVVKPDAGKPASSPQVHAVPVVQISTVCSKMLFRAHLLRLLPGGKPWEPPAAAPPRGVRRGCSTLLPAAAAVAADAAAMASCCCRCSIALNGQRKPARVRSMSGHASGSRACGVRPERYGAAGRLGFVAKVLTAIVSPYVVAGCLVPCPASGRFRWTTSTHLCTSSRQSETQRHAQLTMTPTKFS